MTWAQLREYVLMEMDRNENEVDDSLFKKMIFYANKGLNTVANNLYDNIKFHIFQTYKEHDFDVEQIGPNIYKITVQDEMNNTFHFYGSTPAEVIHNATKGMITSNIPHIETMPDDFIGFTGYVQNYYMINNKWATDPNLNYIGRNKVAVHLPGKYAVHYKARFPDITGNENDVIADIPTDILYALPSYIASNLLNTEDPQRAMHLMNEFEIQINRVENDIIQSPITLSNEGVI